ncbi:hypothetical protein ABIA33_007367 [Streptacidiphilus sp. MAP12-16]|uniref:hypothetical protein n=1 Tax=Streptacidiphilus sp. MAP12-16 TaxID=3156300 RepID=UPI003511AF12
MTPNPAIAPVDSASTPAAPDPVRSPGRHLIQQRLGAARPRDLLARATHTGNPALAPIAAQLTDTAARLDATADTLARHLTTLRNYADRLAAGARVTPCFASAAMTTLGAEIDLCLHRQDLLREQLHAQIDTYTHLDNATATRR